MASPETLDVSRAPPGLLPPRVAPSARSLHRHAVWAHPCITGEGRHPGCLPRLGDIRNDDDLLLPPEGTLRRTGDLTGVLAAQRMRNMGERSSGLRGDATRWVQAALLLLFLFWTYGYIRRRSRKN